MRSSERMSTQVGALLLVSLLVSVGCGTSGPPPPATLDKGNESCGYCRMTVSDRRFAGQIVAPGEQPLFFDDIGCLGNHVKSATGLPRGAIAYVADHQTEAWVTAKEATYTRVERIATPMGSHLIAHATAAGRDADPAAQDGAQAGLQDIFGPAGPPDGSR